jgi:integrase
MSKLEREGGKKQKLKNLMKRGGVWYFKKMVGGKVASVSLNTSDLELAKSRRTVLIQKAFQERWDEIDNVKTKRNIATIGEIILRYKGATDLQLKQRTMDDNVWALRHVIKRTKGLESVDNQPATILDGALVRAWQQECLKGKDGQPLADKLKADSAAVSSNSVLAQARSVFSKRAMARNIYDKMNIPDLEDFLKAPILEELRRDTYTKPDDELLQKIWKEAHKLRDGFEGTEKEPKVIKNSRMWLLFYIVSQTGMRRGEMCSMRYRWFQDQDGEAVVKTCFETDFIPKGKRERNIPVVAGVEQECRRVALEESWSAKPEDYVLPGNAHEKEELFRAFGKWMTDSGWNRKQKAHELRKVFASDFLESNEPYDAQMALGHQDLKTTSRYAARRKVTAVDQSTRYAKAA